MFVEIAIAAGLAGLGFACGWLTGRAAGREEGAQMTEAKYAPRCAELEERARAAEARIPKDRPPNFRAL